MVTTGLSGTGLNPDWKLCLYSDGFAYFSPLDPTEVTGDDWNDAPASHNASPPNNTDYYRVYVQSEYQTPDELEFQRINRFRMSGFDARYVSADEYAAKKHPVLVYATWDAITHPPVWAGITFTEFACQVIASGGEVFVPWST